MWGGENCYYERGEKKVFGPVGVRSCQGGKKGVSKKGRFARLLGVGYGTRREVSSFKHKNRKGKKKGLRRRISAGLWARGGKKCGMGREANESKHDHSGWGGKDPPGLQRRLGGGDSKGEKKGDVKEKKKSRHGGPAAGKAGPTQKEKKKTSEGGKYTYGEAKTSSGGKEGEDISPGMGSDDYDTRNERAWRAKVGNKRGALGQKETTKPNQINRTSRPRRDQKEKKGGVVE